MSSPPQPLAVQARASTSNVNASSSLLETRTRRSTRSSFGARPNTVVNPADPTPPTLTRLWINLFSGGDGSYDFAMLASANSGRGADGTTAESSIQEWGLPSAAQGQQTQRSGRGGGCRLSE
ncbi:hypothetical protein GUJ93_ZPchr0010g8292 [Zizania palustris]|uniref:Uncharacterized protein n=1 Tax=Zizania palustris TaxID=103762 RepID=A0A8J5WFY4_ZIZPA|nr:hypothetical protein GUJ93_ZPchr0010g8292 [Zizania palustris]